MSEAKKDSSSVGWMVVKCGITTLAAFTAILLFYYYPEDFVGAGAVAMDGISGFFGFVFGNIGRLFALIATVPMVVFLVMGGLYAWGLCVASKLKKTNQMCDGYHYLRIAIHKLVMIMWVILVAKSTLEDAFAVALTIMVGGCLVLIHYCDADSSKKILGRRKKLKEIHATRRGKR